MKIYIDKDVYTSATERIEWILDTYTSVCVSVSGGKDSTVLFDLVRVACERRNRRFMVMFIDQEAEYQASIDVVRKMMAHPLVDALWYQIPFKMTNSTSYSEEWLHCWDPDKQSSWMRPFEPNSITATPQPTKDLEFYGLVNYVETLLPAGTAQLLGIRSEESLNRYRAVTKNPAVEGVNWSTKGKATTKFYPIYDWAFEDIWAYIGKFSVPYNRVYDYMYAKEFTIPRMRVSCLIHEKSFHCLGTLQEFEADTYEKLLNRIGGIAVAARYSHESTIYAAKELPPDYANWAEYRDYLLDTIPEDKALIFRKRFAKQSDTQRVHRQQVKQILINDWENNIPVDQKEQTTNSLDYWKSVL